MSLKDMDLAKLSKLTSHQIDHVTCLECCKYFIAPATAACGHTLCHSCWRGRRTCPACATQLDRKTLKLNIPLQTLTDHVQILGEAFEKLFNIKLDEFNLDTPGELESEKDPDKNVKDWLTSSQNHFSAPIQNSETFSQDIPSNPLEISASNIIVHTDTKKAVSPLKVVHIPPPQDDWDKIEPMPDPEDSNKKKENIVGPMDIEPFFVDDMEYTTDNPRRSSRKREIKNDDSFAKRHDLSSNMHSSRDSSGENDKKSQKAKQNWNNVKKMRKEFSKLNKKNRSKLNVSIEMVKKTQNLKTNITTPLASQNAYNIDDNTPYNINKENEVANEQHINKQSDDHLITNPAIYTTEKENNKSKENQKSQNEIIPKDELTEYNRIHKKNTQSQSQENNNGNQDVVPEQKKMAFIKKGALNPNKTINPDPIINHNISVPQMTSNNSDDIEISIKVGSTITNIVIKKKQSDVQVKIHTDREVQTSLGPHCLAGSSGPIIKNGNSNNIDINIEHSKTKEQGTVKNVQISDTNLEKTEPVTKTKDNNNIQISNTDLKEPDPATNIEDNNYIKKSDLNLDKTTSGKKNTASADTATVQFEITESVEKELSNIMECDIVDDKEENSNKSTTHQAQDKMQNTKSVKQQENVDDLNDLDIFNSGSVQEANIHLLKEHAPSEILAPTVRSKLTTQKLVEKRDRENNDEETLPKNKKFKITPREMVNVKDIVDKVQQQPDSEPITYDAIMGQVFANIDADMEDIRKSQEVGSISILKDTDNTRINKVPVQNTTKLTQKQNTQIIRKNASQVIEEITPNINEYFNEKHSENVFSILEKEDENSEVSRTSKIPQQVEELLTPVLCQNLNSTQESQDSIQTANKASKKSQDYDDSDKSVVEETPQKNMSFTNLKRVSTINQSQINFSQTKKISSKTSLQGIKSIINLTDTVTESNKSIRDVTVIDTVVQKQALETPLTISKFADQIKHKSTPMARKSLNFENEDDPEQTLCPTSEVIAKTTQEKEFMSKAFESTPPTPAVRPLAVRNLALVTNRKYCLAGSCLTSTEIAKVKILCHEYKWSYVDKYTKDITHLIVGVDEDKKSQRSVKYMCALAASKWIVSFEWVKLCLQTKEVVNEEYFEAFDSTGEPGPRRSRIAKKKLFTGITFYCMPPFSVLDVDTLKNILLDAGGRVVPQAKDVRISGDSWQPALLLAEPEHTQEDRFIYLAMEQSIVPVNYEWVLNCLGSYTLGSVQELLLCPSSLLPAATAKWPEVLLTQDY